MASDWRQQSTSRGRPSEAHNGVQSKWLIGKAFLLEVENRHMRTKVAECVQNAGAIIIDSFDDRNPHCVVSDHPIALKLEKAKKDDSIFTSERMLKAMPALLRQAVNKEIKVRTPQTFLNQMTSFLNRKGKTTSATTSYSTIRGKPSLGHSNSVKVERNIQKVVPVTSRISSDQPSTRTREPKPFLRIDVPGRKPEVRFVDKQSFGMLYAGKDTGFSVFKIAETALVERRQREYDLFLKGKFEPAKKSFKLDERDNYCQFCQKSIVGDKKDHERTDEHRSKTKIQGLTPTLERIVQNARLRAKRQEDQAKRKQKMTQESAMLIGKSKRAGVEFEYGENEMRTNWQILKPNTVNTIGKKTSEKPSVLSPRRRQKRIRSISSQEDIP